MRFFFFFFFFFFHIPGGFDVTMSEWRRRRGGLSSEVPFWVVVAGVKEIKSNFPHYLPFLGGGIGIIKS